MAKQLNVVLQHILAMLRVTAPEAQHTQILQVC